MTNILVPQTLISAHSHGFRSLKYEVQSANHLKETTTKQIQYILHNTELFTVM